MPEETYEVHNISRGPVSCTVYKSYTIPEGTPKHKRRKMLKESSINVLIPPQQSRELVSLTGLSVNELKAQPELNKILHGSPPRLVLLSPRKVSQPAQPPKEPDPPEEPKKEEPEKEVPAEPAQPPKEPDPPEEPKKEEPKKKTKSKKKKK